MKSRTAVRLLSAVAALAFSTPAAAQQGLLDRGPASATTGYPAWYRDGIPGSPGTALQLCLSSTVSRLAPPPGNEMCFPVDVATQLFPGSRGDENFYFLAGTALENPASGFQARLDLALEAAYGGGAPLFGDEMVFARVRVIIDAPVAGSYVVRHPYGTIQLDDVPAGNRAVTFTEDIGLTVRGFDEALHGKIGPFLQWDTDLADLVYTHPGAPTEVFIGDPSVPHTVTGSPIGFNRFEVEYLGAADLDGNGGSVAGTDLFSVLGQKFTDRIPVPLQVTRASYSAADGAEAQVDVWAITDAATGLYVSGDAFPTQLMGQDGPAPGSLTARYQASFRVATPPGAVTVSSVADPLAHLTRALVDELSGATASYDPAAQLISVSACSSDRRAGGAALFASGVALAPGPTPGCASGALSGVVFPPPFVEIASSRGGRAQAPVVLASAPSLLVTSVATGDGPYQVLEGAAAAVLEVGANDLDGGAAGTAGLVVILTAPARGTAVGGAGQVSYTPAPFYFGPDRLTYAFVDAAGRLSNAAEVRVDVVEVDNAPVAAADTGTVANTAGQAVTIAVLANDVDPEGRPLAVTAVGTPSNGTATLNAGGTVTYRLTTPFPAAPASDTFTYVVSDGVNAVTGTVTISVTAALENLQVVRADYVQNKRRWRVEGSSSFPGPGNAVTIYNGPLGGATTRVLAANVPVDGAGLWAWDSGANAPVPPASNPGIVTVVSTGGAVATRSIAFR